MTKKTSKTKDMQTLIDTGKDKGFLTYDEINDAFPNKSFSVEDMDTFLETLGDLGIDVMDTDDKGNSAEPAKTTKSTAADTERVEDPVRIYMREMGAVSLLKREEEIIYAKGIEEGHIELTKLTLLSPFASREVLRLSDRIRSEKTTLKNLLEDTEELNLVDPGIC